VVQRKALQKPKVVDSNSTGTSIPQLRTTKVHKDNPKIIKIDIKELECRVKNFEKMHGKYTT
jgi:hypothetical protein